MRLFIFIGLLFVFFSMEELSHDGSLIGTIIFLFVFISNTISLYFFNIKIDLYKWKFGQKKSPIYKLDKNNNGLLSVYRYEIKYDVIKELIVIPFGLIFKFPKYVVSEYNYGDFHEDCIEDFMKIDLKEFYEKEHNKTFKKINERKILKGIRENIMDNLNKDFNENY